MKIGITTLHNYNYGSALQCFALQSYLARHFCDSELLCKEVNSGRVVSLAKSAVDLGMLCLQNPAQASKILRLFLSQRGKSLTLQADSKAAIEQFVRTSLRKRTLPKKQLQQLGRDPQYKAFIAGSDQVWNGARIDGYDMYFLRFAPAHKRIAYAPSFGGGEVASYNQKKYRKYIAEFASVSAREDSGAEIIYALTGRKAPVLADPVCLLDADQWRNEIRENTFFSGESIISEDPYILAFFLNRPSEKALEGLKTLQLQKQCPVYSIGYRYEALESLNEYRHLDGSPWAFLQMIDRADMVVTDSFHATVFSLIFDTPFYVFSRSYTHSQNQSIRITGLLENVGMPDRFDSEQPDAAAQFSTQSAQEYFGKLCEKSHRYLTEALGMTKKEDVCIPSKIELLPRKNVCCGCGACAEVCPVGAITMVRDEIGADYPEIDREKCVECGACMRVCALKKEVRPGYPKVQRAYVGFGVDEVLTERSSSGGIFAVLARWVLTQGGVVYGAAVCFENDKLRVQHIGIEDAAQLHRIQGSKYTQSSTLGIFSQVKEKLDGGRTVLFSGTSCQVAALKAFLKKDYPLLYTVDLVCHGVPGTGFFEAHTAYLEGKYKMQLLDLSFRSKAEDTPYVLTVTGTNNRGERIQRQSKLRDAAFFRMFMGCEGYRDSCYSCPYASMKKPADITLGDYAPNDREKEALGIQPGKPYYSFLMTNSPAGELLLASNAEHIRYVEIGLKTARQRHHNLRCPSIPSNRKLWKIYRGGGFRAVERYVRRRNLLVALPKWVLGILRRKKV